MALASGRRLQIFHSDQGCQFTSSTFAQQLKAEEIQISWSGRKRCYDNILIEHLWRTDKYVAAGYSAEPSRGVSACLQRWLGSGDQSGPRLLEVRPCKTAQRIGRQNSP